MNYFALLNARRAMKRAIEIIDAGGAVEAKSLLNAASLAIKLEMNSYYPKLETGTLTTLPTMPVPMSRRDTIALAIIKVELEDLMVKFRDGDIDNQDVWHYDDEVCKAARLSQAKTAYEWADIIIEAAGEQA